MFRPASRRAVKYVPIFGVLAFALLMSAPLRAADPAADVPSAPDAAAPESPDDDAAPPTPNSNPKDDLAAPPAPPAIEVQKPEPEAEVQEPVHKKRGKTYEDEYGKTSGLLGPLTFGPSITLLALTRPFAAGLEFKFLDLFGFAGYYSFMPQVHFRDSTVKYHAWDARFRWYVFRGAFFVGAAIGQQDLNGSDNDDFSASKGLPAGSLVYTANLDMKTTFVVPHIGWNWEWQSGFFMGMDIGAQLTMSESATVSSDAPTAVQSTQQYINLSNKVTNDANKIGKITLPLITFIKLGWMF